MLPRMSRLIAPQGRWALSGFLAVALGATLASSGITASGASTLAHHAGAPASRPYVKLQPRGVAHPLRAGNLINHGGPVQNAPRVYVVFWGWTSDPHGEQPYLTRFLSSVGGTSWLSTVNQYSGAGWTGDLLAGTWSDSASVPLHPSDSQIQSEAARAAAHFGAGTSVNVEIV